MSADERAPPALPAAALRVLADHRAHHRMPAQSFARVAARLEAAEPGRGRIAVVALLAAALTIAVLAVWELARRGTTRDEHERSQAGDVIAPVEHRGELVGATPPATVPARPPDVTATTTADTPVTPAPLQRPHARSEPAPAVVPVDEDAASTLRAERELLASAREALTAGELDRVLELAARHLARFPRGLLAPEVAAVATMARCRKQPARAADELAAFVAAHPGAALLPTVREACSRK